MRSVKIGKRMIGDGEPLYFIADIAANHDGELERALMLIELAAESGADAAKFQNFVAERIVSRKGFESVGRHSHQASWKKPVFEVYRDASISREWTSALKEKCMEVGIDYFSSPYDFESVDHIDPFVDVYKIGSGDITWLEILDYIASKNKPVILATGASTMEDVKRAMKTLRGHTDEIVLMQCNTNYTGSAENFNYLNLNVLKTYSEEFPGTLLGLSDHTPGHASVTGAVALGARVFEKHFTDDNNREGPDHKFAMNPESWKQMVENANACYRALGDGVKRIEKNEMETVFLQRRGLRFTSDLPAGHKVTKNDIFPLRPATAQSVPPYRADEIIGRRLARDVCVDDEVSMEDFTEDSD